MERRERSKVPEEQKKPRRNKNMRNKNQNYTETINENQDSPRKKNKENREIAIVLYIVLSIMFLCIGYFVVFVGTEGKTVINNSYNKRQVLLSKRILRGSILSADGEKLAYSVENEDGTQSRIYPYDNLFVHVVGRYDNTKTGIESSEDFTLLTSSINPLEMMFNELSGEKSIGDNIITTLDYNLQKIASDALGNRRGAIVVMEPSTGKILAMVSKPNYNPNTVLQQWDSLISDEADESPLINRTTQGLYPPGSIYKILTVLEYIRQNPNYEDYSYDCTGEAKFNDVVIHCYNNKSHGKQNLIESFANSCNTSFANIGASIDLAEFRKLNNSFLFNSNLPLSMPYNKSSFVLSETSDKNEIPQTVIGQGETLITPMHAALIVSTIANGGDMMTPYVIDSVENYHGKVISKNLPKLYKNIISAKEAEILTEFMQAVVESGTGSALKNSKYTVAGKTGTAEYKEGEKAHAWFVGFAPAEQPEIAVSIIVESSGAGSDYAVPIAKKIFDEYLNR